MTAEQSSICLQIFPFKLNTSLTAQTSVLFLAQQFSFGHIHIAETLKFPVHLIHKTLHNAGEYPSQKNFVKERCRNVMDR